MGFTLSGLINGAATGAAQNAEEANKSDIELAKAKALAQFNIDAQNSQRQRASDAINQNYQGIINAKGLSNWNAANDIQEGDDNNPTYRPGTMDDVNNGTINLSSEQDAQLSQRDDTMAHLQAEAQYTNDYSKLATLQNSSDIAQNKWDTLQTIANDHDATKQYIADQQNQTRQMQIQMMALLKGSGGGADKADAETLKAGLESSLHQMTVFAGQLKDNPDDPTAKAGFASAALSNSLFLNQAKKKLGIDTTTPPPAAAIPPWQKYGNK